MLRQATEHGFIEMLCGVCMAELVVREHDGWSEVVCVNGHQQAIHLDGGTLDLGIVRDAAAAESQVSEFEIFVEGS